MSIGFAAMLLSAAAAAPVTAADAASSPCLTGAFRNASGSILVLALDENPADRRFILSDGRTGVLRPTFTSEYRAGPGWSASMPVVAHATLQGCHPKQVGFSIERGPNGRWSKIALRETSVRFRSGDVTLSGRWVRPEGAKPSPAVVLVHGSADTPYVDREAWQWMLPAMGVSILVYNKRGTGDSTGAYTQDFSTLADDAAAAIATVRKVGGAGVLRLGVLGLSQGGWVAPLAATRAPVDFVQVNYGVVGTPLEQDQWQVRYELRLAGYGEDILKRADRLTAASADVAATDFHDHLDRFDTILKAAAGEPWIHGFEGQYTGLLVRGAIDQARNESPQVPWHYDSLATLRKLTVPQFWIMAADDSLAPSQPTIDRLITLREQGYPIEIAVFPNTEHGIREFRSTAKGRERVRWADGYFRLEADWILGLRRAAYGQAHLITPSPKN